MSQLMTSMGWSPDRAVVDAIRESALLHEPEAWALLKAVVAVDSNPDDLPGIERVMGLIEPAFGRLGLQTSIERTADGHPVLHASTAALGGSHDRLRVIMIGHLDTVFPSGRTADWRFESVNGRAGGPGIADAKGGVVVIWLALASALAATSGLPGLEIRVLVNSDEEAGSVQSRPIIEREAQSTDLALVYEPGRPDGSIVRQRRGARRYRIEIAGKASHTGVEPWAGVNAIEAAAHKVLALQALNDRERMLSVTVATIEGGTRVNVVPDNVIMQVDTRLPDRTTAESTHDAVLAIVASEEVLGARASYQIVSDRPPMMPQPGVEETIEHFRVAAAALGLEFSDTATGGGSDGCFLSQFGVPTVDALGPVGGGYHTDAEYINEGSLMERAELSALALASFAHARRDLR